MVSVEGGHVYISPQVKAQQSIGRERRNIDGDIDQNPKPKLGPLGLNDFGGQFSSPGGSLYTGPIITKVAKSMKATQAGTMDGMSKGG